MERALDWEPQNLGLYPGYYFDHKEKGLILMTWRKGKFAVTSRILSGTRTRREGQCQGGLLHSSCLSQGLYVYESFSCWASASLPIQLNLFSQPLANLLYYSMDLSLNYSQLLLSLPRSYLMAHYVVSFSSASTVNSPFLIHLLVQIIQILKREKRGNLIAPTCRERVVVKV